MTNRIFEDRGISIKESEYALCAKCEERFFLEFHKCD